ncbi:MAG: STAS domain-containing protein [Pseudomonadota bacterium]
MASLEQFSETEYILKGDLIFSSCALIYEQSLHMFKKNTQYININLQQVTRADSSALALIVEWYRLSKKNNMQLKVTDMPKQMCDLAKLSSVDELLAE